MGTRVVLSNPPFGLCSLTSGGFCDGLCLSLQRCFFGEERELRLGLKTERAAEERGRAPLSFRAGLHQYNFWYTFPENVTIPFSLQWSSGEHG